MQSRYDRQMLLKRIGPEGQQRLGCARVLLVGCGALGSVIAEQLVRAGVGYLRIVDRDIVELSNLQRQVLFDEEDARQSLPKAIAAQRRLSRINSQVEIDALVKDVHAGNIEDLLDAVVVILDGTDNAETRYLINDVSIKHGIPWIYGACVGTVGRMMPVIPGRTPCLRCIFPTPPAAGELPSCDTIGVLGPVAAAVASLQAATALKLLTGAVESIPSQLLVLDLWENRLRSLSVERSPDCPTCAHKRFDFLHAAGVGSTATLCGRHAVQISAPSSQQIDLHRLARRLAPVAAVDHRPYFLRCSIDGLRLTIFPDGRGIVEGTTDPARARSLYARYIGT